MFVFSVHNHICWTIWSLIEGGGKQEKILNVYKNDCLKTIMGISFINLIKINNVKSDLEKLNKITSIIKMKGFK